MELFQQSYRPLGEEFRAGCGIEGRKLDDRMGPAKKGQPGTQVFIGKGRRSPLDEITAHNNQEKIRTGLEPCLFKLVAVAVVEGIVFSDDGCSLHKISFHVSGLIYYKMYHKTFEQANLYFNLYKILEGYTCCKKRNKL